MRFYLNGKIQGEEDVKNPRSTGTELITLGQRGDKGGHLTKGLYDQVRFWNRPLSANEIHQLNKAPSSPPPTKGLLLNHDFGQGYQPPHWKNTTLRLSLSDGRKVFKTQKKVSGLWKIGQSQELTLNRDFDNTPAQNPALKLSLTTADKKIHPLDFNPKTNSYYGYFKKGSYIKGGYRDIRNYDEYLIKIENTGDSRSTQ